MLAQGRLLLLLEYWPFGLRGAETDPAELEQLLRGFTLYVPRGDRWRRVQSLEGLIPAGSDHFCNVVAAKGCPSLEHA